MRVRISGSYLAALGMGRLQLESPLLAGDAERGVGCAVDVGDGFKFGRRRILWACLRGGNAECGSEQKLRNCVGG